MQKNNRMRINNKIKISKALRAFLILLSIVIFAFGSGNLIKTFKSKDQITLENKEAYKYKNNLKTDSKINLRENEYIKEDEMISDQTYLSDLISDIDLGLNYNYKGNAKSNITYNYKIEAVVSAIYSNNGKTYDVLNKVEELKKVEDSTINSDEFKIDEKINVNYTKYHQFIKNFKQEMGLNTDSNLYIRLTVNTKTDINSQKVENTYVSNYSITLGEKIALVSYESNDTKEETVKYEIETRKATNIDKKMLFLDIGIMIIGFALFMFITKRTEELRSIRNEFKLELNRILRSCEEKIVQIEDIKQIDIKHATKVKDITQLLKLSDEALVPIYCYIKEEPEQEAYFIVTKYEKNYIFILK